MHRHMDPGAVFGWSSFVLSALFILGWAFSHAPGL